MIHSNCEQHFSWLDEHLSSRPNNNEWLELCGRQLPKEAKGSISVPSRRCCIRDNDVVHFTELSKLPDAQDVPNTLMVSQKDLTVNTDKTSAYSNC